MKTPIHLLAKFPGLAFRCVLSLVLLSAFSVSAQFPNPKEHAGAPRVPGPIAIDVVESSEDLHESLQDKPPLHFGSSREAGPAIEVDDSIQYQQMDGFGASLTDSSAWLISQKLSAQQRHELLQMLFDPKKGIGLSMLRQPMGASDFALKDYTYADLPPGQTDPDSRHFSIDHDPPR